MSSSILKKKYLQYLLPSIITSLALALNEFVDGCLVSNMLGSDALAIINLTCPVILLIAAVAVLLSSGGSTLFSLYLGAWKKRDAGKVFRASMVMAVVGGFLFAVIGYFLRQQAAEILCADELLREQMLSFYDILLLAAPVQIILLTYVSFLPSSGAPVIASVVNLTANGVNLVMDVVFIKGVGCGIEGAGYATITGYLVGCVVMVILMKRKHITIESCKLEKRDRKLFLSIISQGFATSLLQICYAVKYTYSNRLAFLYGGRSGVVAFALCLQTFSIASVFLLGIADTAQPLLAVLSGQSDYEGQRQVLRRSLGLQILFSLLLIGVFETFPRLIALIYGISEPEVFSIADVGIRIFALTYLPRGLYIQFMRFFQVEQKQKYAFFISIFDGVAVMPIGFILCHFFGLNGVFASYPFCALLLFGIVYIRNMFIFSKNQEVFSSWMLVKKHESDDKILNITITDKPEDISSASEQLQDFCMENEVSPKVAFRVGLLCEEMGVYTSQHRKEKGDIDLLLMIRENEITLDFRSIGVPFDPNQKSEEDIEENVLLLQKAATEISYNYCMGMNNTRIRMAKGI